MAVGHQVAAPLPAAVWTEMLIAALNQSTAIWEMSPMATVIETQLVRGFTSRIGWDAEAGGTLTSGGTEATFTALLAARAHLMPDSWERGVGERAPVIVCGEHAHYCVSRAAGQLGLGTARAITVSSRDWRMDPQALAATLDCARDEGNAGDGRRGDGRIDGHRIVRRSRDDRPDVRRARTLAARGRRARRVGAPLRCRIGIAFAACTTRGRWRGIRTR